MNLNGDKESESKVESNFGYSGAPESVKTPKKKPITIKRNLVYIGVVVIFLIALFVYVMAQLVVLNSQCTSNPFLYGAQNIESSRGETNVFCSCAMEGGGSFYFDDKQLYTENPLLQQIINS